MRRFCRMKNAREYQRKIKKLLRGLKAASAPEVAPGLPRVHFMIETILQVDATRRQAAAAVGPLQEEYVDLNELRVSPIKDVTDCLGKDMPGARENTEMLLKVLNNLFLRTNDISLDWLAETSKRELRRTLTELGLGPYAGAAVAMLLFGVPTIPVDRTLVECLKADGYVHPESDLATVQGFLEKLASPRSALAVHEALRNYCEKRAKTLPKRPPGPAVTISSEAEGLGAEKVAAVPLRAPGPVPPPGKPPVGKGGKAAPVPVAKVAPAKAPEPARKVGKPQPARAERTAKIKKPKKATQAKKATRRSGRRR